jgi:hypothetical protein
VMDRRRRIVHFGPLVRPGSDLDADLAALRHWYATQLG